MEPNSLHGGGGPRQLEFTGQSRGKEEEPQRKPPQKLPRLRETCRSSPQMLSRALMDSYILGNFWRLGKEFFKGIGTTIPRVHADET